MSDNLQKVFKKVQMNLDNGDYYEALQQLKTLYYRQRSKKQEDLSNKLLEEGAIKLFEKQQVNAAFELACMLVEGYKNDKAEANSANVKSLVNILSKCPSGKDLKDVVPSDVEKFMYIANQWIYSQQQYSEVQVQELQDIAGGLVWRTANLRNQNQVTALLSRSANMDLLCEVLQRSMKDAPQEEKQYFIARACLQMLAAGDKPFERVSARDNVKELLELLQPLPDAPLINFITLLTETLEMQNIPLFLRVVEIYKPFLQVDQKLQKLVDAIGFNYFNIKPQKTGMEGLLGNVMQMFQ